MTEQNVPVSDERKPRERQHWTNDIPAGGIFLLFLGTVLLLQTLDVLPWTLWNTLWRFWPVLLINSGLSILLRRYNVWLVSLVLLALLLGSLGLAIQLEEKPLPAGSNAGVLFPGRPAPQIFYEFQFK
jgi:hypothetical protein